MHRFGQKPVQHCSQPVLADPFGKLAAPEAFHAPEEGPLRGIREARTGAADCRARSSGCCPRPSLNLFPTAGHLDSADMSSSEGFFGRVFGFVGGGARLVGGSGMNLHLRT